MTLPLNTLYQEIGEALANSIQDSWIFANLIVEINSDVTSTQGYYVQKEGGIHHSIIADYSVVKLFRKLYTEMSKTSKGKWKKAQFGLYLNGKFELSFEYTT